MSAALTPGRPPEGFWAQRLDWEIETPQDSVRARMQARDAVAAGEAQHPPHPSGHVFAAASERVALAIGELTTNGLRHGDQPVTASLSRGGQGWLLVVSDEAEDRAPAAPGPDPIDPTTVGGLGLRLVMSLAAEIGWHVERGRKQVWALIGDTPPPSLVATLDRAIS